MKKLRPNRGGGGRPLDKGCCQPVTRTGYENVKWLTLYRLRDSHLGG
jgi:hypothetical protein